MNNDFLFIMMAMVVIMFVIPLIRNLMSSSRNSSTASTSTTTSTAKPQTVSKTQMAEDIRATKTSRVVDAVSILDDLGTTNQNYRHYCELVGTSMGSSNVIAPYSKRPVAFYDIKCYRIDATYGGGQEETLVAHEHSFDPFFFTDGSSPTPIYVDLESFGSNVILVNSTNHIEGPNSDFSRAMQQNTQTATSGSSSAYAMVARAAQAGSNLLRGAREAMGQLGLLLHPQPMLQPACATVGGSQVIPSEDNRLGSNLLRAHAGHGGGGRSRMGQRPSGSFSRPHPSSQSSRPTAGRPNHIPDHLGDFMHTPSSMPWVMGGGYTTHHRPPTYGGSSAGNIILGMSLQALLNSMSQTQQVGTMSSQVDTFRGYRLVENIVPVGSPIYCIGEIYRHGTDVYMSRSLAKDYPTSYFATKPEAEVLSAIGAV